MSFDFTLIHKVLILCSTRRIFICPKCFYIYLRRNLYGLFAPNEWCGSSDVLLLGSKQELVFGTNDVLVIEKTLQDKLYIKCPMSPLSRLRLNG